MSKSRACEQGARMHASALHPVPSLRLHYCIRLLHCPEAGTLCGLGALHRYAIG